MLIYLMYFRNRSLKKYAQCIERKACFLVVWMFSGRSPFPGCLAVWLFGCLDVWMFGCLDVFRAKPVSSDASPFQAGEARSSRVKPVPSLSVAKGLKPLMALKKLNQNLSNARIKYKNKKVF